MMDLILPPSLPQSSLARRHRSMADCDGNGAAVWRAAAQYSIELLAQWDRKRRPIPLAGRHFGKVVLIHLPKLPLSEQSTL